MKEEGRRETKGGHENLGNDVRKDKRVIIQNMVKVKGVPKKHIDRKSWHGAYGPIAVFMAKDNKALEAENERQGQTIIDMQEEKNGMQLDLMQMEEANEMMHNALLTSNIELAETRGSLEQMTSLARSAIQELKKREWHARKKDEKIRKLKEAVPYVTVRVENGMPRLTTTSFFEQRMEDIMDIGWLASDEVLSEEEEV